MTAIDVDQFELEGECTYRDEDYLVRDNGAVLRRSRVGKRKRALDEKWTFGKKNNANPYLHLAGVRVHRIVATAFHGDPPEPNYVADHIDSNCRNNRPENLRWLTRLENAVLNPVTRKKIEYLCGSIEAFLENPSMLNSLRAGPSFAWMRSVTPQEAENCMRRMSLWAKTETKALRSGGPIDHRRSFERRAFKPLQKWEAGLAREPGLEFALTLWCGKYMWEAAVRFPCCPQDLGSNPLDAYFRNLRVDAVFASCDADRPTSQPRHPDMLVSKALLLESESSIVVMCSRPDSLWSLVGVTLNDRSHFIHHHLGSFGEMAEAERAMSRKRPADFWKDAYSGARDPF